ncbi:MAG: 50S ribosomal protein L16 [Anaerolineae bacterium]|uniref:50S ribosomal protein L16 n=1 Tax=Candidatus Amarolinea dominans TaxID=3140696 RepID=UPI001DEF98DE|nr:50S ribosomal protein L16 [Anaerolineae bacterium]MBK7201432.1 50S ribosomal protein L16 [Anaerolineae bacterium]MBK9095108.1 50S ribosomal protein L16 [Anaerolineae bacterium]MBK9232557.1 50S ribosomal protein L16 [Anaerolineae bacterium]
MLMPKRVKYRKMHRGHMRGTAGRGNQVAFGEYGMQALEPCWMTSRQIEAARRTIVRFIRRGGKLWIRVFPDKPVTKKPAETRMGSGKGPVDHWVAVVRPGLMLFELAGVTEEAAKEAFQLASFKLSIRTQIVSRAAESAAPEVAGEAMGAVATGAAA